MITRRDTVAVVLHDGFYGAGTGAGHSNRAFLDVLATLLAPGIRLAVLPVELAGASTEYDPAWHAAAREIVRKAGSDVIPVGNGTAGMTRWGGLPHFRCACSNAAAAITSLLPGAGRLLVVAFDVPFFGLAALLPQAARPALVTVVRSAAAWHAPDDTARTSWEYDGLSATVAGGGRLAAISQAVRTHLTAGLGMPAGAVVDLANGLTPREQYPAASAAGASLLLPPAAAGGFLLAAGRAEPYKGFDDLLDAIAILRACRVPVPHTVIAAVTEDPHPSAYQQHLARRISTSQLDVTLLTAYSPGVRSLLGHPGLAGVIVPSRAEPAGRIPLEAFAAGATPVIATSAGGLAETVTEGRTGYSARPGDPASLAGAVHRALAAPPGEHQRLLQAGRRMLAEQYDYAANVSAFLARAAPWALDSAARPAASVLKGNIASFHWELPMKKEGSAVSTHNDPALMNAANEKPYELRYVDGGTYRLEGRNGGQKTFNLAIAIQLANAEAGWGTQLYVVDPETDAVLWAGVHATH